MTIKTATIVFLCATIIFLGISASINESNYRQASAGWDEALAIASKWKDIAIISQQQTQQCIVGWKQSIDLKP